MIDFESTSYLGLFRGEFFDFRRCASKKILSHVKRSKIIFDFSFIVTEKRPRALRKRKNGMVQSFQWTTAENEAKEERIRCAD